MGYLDQDGLTYLWQKIKTAIDEKLEGVTAQEVYSTEEQRIGTWIDGKPLYRITIPGTTPESINTNTNIANVSHLDIYILTNRRCVFFGSVGEKKVAPFIPTPSQPQYMLDFDIYQNYIRAWTASNAFTGRPAAYILEYTKNNDTAATTLSAQSDATIKLTNSALDLSSIQAAPVTAADAGAEIAKMEEV